MGYPWDPVRGVIYELYVVQGQTLRQVMRRLEENRYWTSSGLEKGPCARSFREKLSKWGYLRKDSPEGSIEGGGGDGAANPETSTTRTTKSASVVADPDSISLQVGYSGRAVTTPSDMEFGIYPSTVQFHQPGGENDQIQQFQYDDTQDCQDPECWAFRGEALSQTASQMAVDGGECTCGAEIMCGACVMACANLEE